MNHYYIGDRVLYEADPKYPYYGLVIRVRDGLVTVRFDTLVELCTMKITTSVLRITERAAPNPYDLENIL